MSEDEAHRNLLKRIKRMLDISSRDTTTEAEAAIALEKAQLLLAKHNLSMEEVMRIDDQGFIIVKGKVVDTFAYMRTLGMAVGKMYFCKYYVEFTWVVSKKNGNRYRRERHCFVGLPHNAEIALMMFDYIVKQIGRLAKADAANVEKKAYWGFITAFQVGASRRVAARIYDLIPKPEATAAPSTGSTALTLADLYTQTDQRITKYLEEAIGGLEAIKTKVVEYDGQGYAAGERAGNSIGLDVQVTQNNAKRLA